MNKFEKLVQLEQQADHMLSQLSSLSKTYIFCTQNTYTGAGNKPYLSAWVRGQDGRKAEINIINGVPSIDSPGGYSQEHTEEMITIVTKWLEMGES
jgi:hypothetical protein